MSARTAVVLPDGRIATGTFWSSYAVYDPGTDRWDLEGIEIGPALNAMLSSGAHVHAVGDAGRVWTDSAPLAEMGSLCNFLAEPGANLYTGGLLGRVFDARSGAVLYEHHVPLICATGFEVGGHIGLAVGTYTGEILLFGVGHDGALTLDKTLAVYHNAVKGLSCSDGLLFSVCASTDIAWHRLPDGAQVRKVTQAHERIANACCEIGLRRFASVGRDRTLRLWHCEHSESFGSPHSNSVKCIAVNDDKTAVLTGCYGGTLARFDQLERR